MSKDDKVGGNDDCDNDKTVKKLRLSKKPNISIRYFTSLRFKKTMSFS